MITERDYGVLFSDEAISAPEPGPPATPRPFLPDNTPEVDPEGYSASREPYFYENPDDGQWVYLTESIQVIINRYDMDEDEICWYEAEILLRNGEKLQNAFAPHNEKKNKSFDKPLNIATENHCAFAFTDDFFGYRIYHKQRVGIIIRDGELLSSKTYAKRNCRTPNLDMLALYADGSMRCYECGSITAEELIKSGAIDVYSFGPILLKDGKIDPIVNNKQYSHHEPRLFLGMIEPNHYFVLAAMGRKETTKGLNCSEGAFYLRSRNVKEAINLDGGATVSLIFHGKSISSPNWIKKKNARSVSSLIYVGQCDFEDE